MRRPSNKQAWSSHTPDRPQTDSGQALDGLRSGKVGRLRQRAATSLGGGRSGSRPDSPNVQKRERSTTVICEDGEPRRHQGKRTRTP